MKIKLIIFPGYFVPHIGGLETHVDEFSKYLSKNKKYDITIFAPNIPISKEKEIIHNNVHVIRYPAFEIVSNFPVPKFWSSKFWSLYFGLYKKDFDITMTRTMFFMNSTIGMFFAKFRFKKTKLIHVEHGADFSKLDSKFKSIINKLYMKSFGLLLIRLSDKIVTVSSASKYFLTKENFVKKNKIHEIAVIRRGFHYEVCNSIKPNLKIKNKYKTKKIITFVGRLIDGKGVQDVLNALKDCDKNYIFLIIGDGNYKNTLENLVNKYDLKEKVNFLGRIPHKEVISILKITDIFINPSYTEGLPTTVIEAFFLGCNVVATDVGGTYEILGKYWNSKEKYKLVKVKDISQMSISLNKLLTVENKIDKKILESVKKRFDWDGHAKKYDLVISEVFE